jgi:N-acetyl-1-D-myo-inositol-2-amino-2-deoxy-alpha-D-glucopyranoside deacetylase
MTEDPASRRLLLVHAHPDDETIETGATMARYAAEGAHLTLVTCTLGELGEIIPPGLAHLAEAQGGGLGGYRIGELDAACAALGVTDHRFLGGAGRFKDSGMMGLPSNDAPGCFWQADPDEAAGLLLRVIDDVRPQVMVSYDQHGFYGHPDHIQAHRVAWRAFARSRAGEPGRWPVQKFYATAMPLSALARAIALDGTSFRRVESAATLPFGIPDDEVTTAVDGRAYLNAKLTAMRAHATQMTVEGAFYALSDGIGLRALGTEYYTLLSEPADHAPPAPPAASVVPRARGAEPGPSWESDLFAGIG